MNCRKMQQDILLSQSGELTGSDATRLQEHLATCDACRQYRADTERVLSLTRAGLPDVDPGPEVIARILAVARTEAGGNAVYMPGPWLRAAFYAAAALFVVCAVGLWSFGSRPLSSASQVSAIIMAVGSEAELKVISRSGKPEKEQELQALASHLLLMEGFAEELPEVELIDAADEPQPTALRSRSIDAFELQKCG